MKKDSKKYSIILDDMDLLTYRLRPIAAISYVQDAFARFTTSKKMAAFDMMPRNLYWIVSEFNIDFLSYLPYWSEEIEAEIWFSEVSKLKFYTDFNIFYRGKIFAKGDALWFLIDKNSKRPYKTDEFLDRIEICSEYTLGAHKKFILPEADKKVIEFIHKNNLSDIDFNNHVNNKSYINLAEMTSTKEFKRTHTIKQLRIKFNRETFLDDVLSCTAYSAKEPGTYIHKIEKDGVSVCDITSSWEDKITPSDILNYELEIKKFPTEKV